MRAKGWTAACIAVGAGVAVYKLTLGDDAPLRLREKSPPKMIGLWMIGREPPADGDWFRPASVDHAKLLLRSRYVSSIAMPDDLDFATWLVEHGLVPPVTLLERGATESVDVFASHCYRTQPI